MFKKISILGASIIALLTSSVSADILSNTIAFPSEFEANYKTFTYRQEYNSYFDDKKDVMQSKLDLRYTKHFECILTFILL